MVVVVGLIGVLLVVAISSFGVYKKRAKKARSIKHLQAIHTGFTSAITDIGEWPQMPEEDEAGDPISWPESKYAKWWIDTMTPYGLDEGIWVHADDFKELAQRRKQQEGQSVGGSGDDVGIYHLSFVPTKFGPGRATPFRWKHPWAMERGGDQLMVMPDGSVKPFTKAF
ncbi:MAG: hypothetical protein AAF226_04645 [Verrucomicrobiota bacterium]